MDLKKKGLPRLIQCSNLLRTMLNKQINKFKGSAISNQVSLSPHFFSLPFSPLTLPGPLQIPLGYSSQERTSFPRKEYLFIRMHMGFPRGTSGKESACKAQGVRVQSLIREDPLE